VEERGVLPRRLVITPHELEFDVREGDVLPRRPAEAMRPPSFETKKEAETSRD
jgi:hypothetical protein